jgi:ribosomal protein L37E
VEKQVCEFCGFELSDDDIRSMSPLSMWPHCRDHSNHATYPQIWLLKKELGVPYEEPAAEKKICAVCGLPLSEDEMKWVKKEHQNFTCRFHRRAVGDFNLDITRQKLGYTDGGLGSQIINLMIKEWKL